MLHIVLSKPLRVAKYELVMVEDSQMARADPLCWTLQQRTSPPIQSKVGMIES